jgi:hypothetical protein
MNPDMANVANEGADAGSHEGDAQTNQASDQDKNWAATREQLSQFKRENERLQQQMQQLHAAYQQGANQPQQPVQNEDDLMTVGEFKRALAEKEAMFQQRLQETQVLSRYSDFNDVVNEQNFTALKEQFPGLGDAVMSSSNPNLLAYALGKHSPSYRDRLAKRQEATQNAQQILDNSQKPGSVSTSMTGGSPISRAEYYAGMSDEEFNAKVAQVKRSGNWTY